VPGKELLDCRLADGLLVTRPSEPMVITLGTEATPKRTATSRSTCNSTVESRPAPNLAWFSAVDPREISTTSSAPSRAACNRVSSAGSDAHAPQSGSEKASANVRPGASNSPSVRGTP
jgi:hypothetical protein